MLIFAFSISLLFFAKLLIRTFCPYASVFQFFFTSLVVCVFGQEILIVLKFACPGLKSRPQQAPHPHPQAHPHPQPQPHPHTDSHTRTPSLTGTAEKISRIRRVVSLHVREFRGWHRSL